MDQFGFLVYFDLIGISASTILLVILVQFGTIGFMEEENFFGNFGENLRFVQRDHGTVF